MGIQVLDPTHESDSDAFQLAPRLKQMEGVVIGVISNGKEGTRAFFDGYERALTETYGVAQVIRLTKANYSAPAQADIMSQALRCDAIVAGIGD